MDSRTRQSRKERNRSRGREGPLVVCDGEELMASIKHLTQQDKADVIALAERSGLFSPEGIALIEERLDQYFAGSGEIWLASGDGEIAGALYCTPEPMTDGTWNILMLIVSTDTHGQGHGRALMSHVETVLAARGARLLIVETSSTDGFERARTFYPKCGYQEEARIKDFYTTGDDKVVFTKSL